ncbi:MAG: hypothetical protein J0H22_08055, partial [Actinobacteria bacterium]|nr:hypothetical protein [Actinomycetota bacterium]
RTDRHRLTGAPRNDPFRLRVVARTEFGTPQRRMIPIGQLRPYIARDLAADISVLLASGAQFDGRPLTAGDIAVIVDSGLDAVPCRDALADLGIPVVYSGDTDVFASTAAAEWLRLLDAFDTPNRSGVVRAAATTMFFGHRAADLAAGGDELTDQITTTIRQWAGLARDRGIAAVFEAVVSSGLPERVLGHRGGERHMTDLAHVSQLLHETAHRERYHLPALRDWLRRQMKDRAGPAIRLCLWHRPLFPQRVSALRPPIPIWRPSFGPPGTASRRSMGRRLRSVRDDRRQGPVRQYLLVAIALPHQRLAGIAQRNHCASGRAAVQWPAILVFFLKRLLRQIDREILIGLINLPLEVG